MAKEFAIRLAVQDGAAAGAALKKVGTEGAEGFKKLGDSATKVSPALKAVDGAAKEAHRSFEGFASRIPVIGGALKSLGPAGLAAGAGIAGLTMAFGAMFNAARKAIDEVGKIKDAADTLMLSAEHLQGLRSEALTAGVEAQVLDKAMQTLALNSARASEGFGKMRAALEKVNPELGRQLALTKTQSERFDILVRGIREAKDENEKLNIAAAAFGGDGAQLIRILDQAGASLDTFTDKAKAAGMVLSEDLVNEVEALGDRLAVLEAKRGVAVQRAAVAFAGAVEGWEKFQTEAILFIPNLQEQAKGLHEKSEEYIRDNIDRWREAAQQRVVSEKWAMEEIAKFEGELQRRREAKAAEASSRVPRGAAGMESDVLFRQRFPDAETAEAKAAREKAATEAARVAADRAREMAAIEKAAISLRVELGDKTLLLSQRQAELNALVGQYGVTQEMANTALEKYRAELDGSADANARVAAVIEASKTPLEKATDALQQLTQEYVDGKVKADLYYAGLPIYIKALEDAATATDKQAGALKGVAKGMVDVAKSTDEAAGASFELRLAAETLNGVFDENINSLEDLGMVAVKVFRQMAMEALLAQTKIGGGGSGGGGIFGAIASFVGSLFGGGMGAPSAGAGASGAAAGLRVGHTGGVVGPSLGTARVVSLDAYRGAPRHHMGLEPGERPIIAQDGERMFSRMDNARIVRAVEAGAAGGGKTEIHIHNNTGGKVETRESRTGDGGTRIDVMIGEAAVAAMAAGSFDGVMGSRYGVGRQTRSR